MPTSPPPATELLDELLRIEDDIAAARTRLHHKQRDQDRAEDRAARARTAADAAAATHRATTDGLATSMRGLELAMLNAAAISEVRELQRQHLQGERDAAAEYLERVSRWGHKSGDGPLFACPIGPSRDFARLAVHFQILGHYRHEPAHPEPLIAVRLALQPSSADPVRRTKINVPAALLNPAITLTAALTHALHAPAEDRKLQAWLGHLYPQVRAALSA